MNSEDLVLRVRADGSGVKETFQGIAKETDRLKITTEKTTSAVRQFANDLRNVRDASDLAGVATRALAQVIGASLGGTAVVIAGKVLLDAFNSVQKTVKETKDSVESSFKDIQESATALTFESAAQQAEMLFKETDKVEKAIKKLEENKLQNFIAGLVGAKDEMAKLSKETRDFALELQKTGLERGAGELNLESTRTELDRAAASAAEKFGPQVEASRRYLNQVESTFEADLKNAKTKEDAERVMARRQDAQNKFEQSIIDQQTAAAKAVFAEQEELRKKTNLEQNKLINQDQEIKDRARAEDINEFQRQIDEKSRKTKEESAEFYKRLEEERKKQVEKQKLERDAIDLEINRLDLEQRLLGQRRQIIQAEGKVAAEVSRQGGTGRGPGQKPTSFEIGAMRKAEKAAQDEAYKLRQQERMRIKGEIETERGIRYDPDTGRPLGGTQASGFDVNRRLSKMMEDAARASQNDIYDDAKNARAGAQATEDTLRNVKDNLQKVLDELKTYAHAT